MNKEKSLEQFKKNIDLMFENNDKERLIFSQCLEKLEELEQGSDSNV